MGKPITGRCVREWCDANSYHQISVHQGQCQDLRDFGKGMGEGIPEGEGGGIERYLQKEETRIGSVGGKKQRRRKAACRRPRPRRCRPPITTPCFFPGQSFPEDSGYEELEQPDQ
jgi:hypothetical protein